MERKIIYKDLLVKEPIERVKKNLFLTSIFSYKILISFVLIFVFYFNFDIHDGWEELEYPLVFSIFFGYIFFLVRNRLERIRYHGIYFYREEDRGICKLPRKISNYFIVTLVLLLIINMTFFGVFAEGIFVTFKGFFFSAFVTVVATLFHWRYVVYYYNYYGDEGAAHSEFVRSGCTIKEVYKNICILRDKGFLY